MTAVDEQTETGTGTIVEEPLRVDGWELTWPIWHMLSLGEKKEIAARRGLTVGAFEEEIYLQRATELSTRQEEEAHRYISANLFANQGEGEGEGGAVASSGEIVDHEHSEDDGSEEDDEEEEVLDALPKVNLDETIGSSGYQMNEVRLSVEQIEAGHGGHIMLLPDEILYRLMGFMDMDSFGVCACVSPFWKHFTVGEMAFKFLCERVYLKQSKKKVLNVERWNSYRNMFINRPRVRLNGIYILKYKQIKRIQRDMWTEIPMGVVLEQIHYRYLCFQENGNVLYALSASPPYEMIPRFVKMKRTNHSDKQAVVGKYEVSKFGVRVWTSHKWSDISLDLIIVRTGLIPGSANFTELTLVRHRLAVDGNFNGEDVVEFDVPTDRNFKFFRVWDL